MKNLLITGASGFVGGHLAEAAVEAGYRVYALVRASSDVRLLKKLNIHLLMGELTNEASLQEVFDRLKSEGVYFDMVIDEGSVITDGMIPNLDKPVAIVGVAEKG